MPTNYDELNIIQRKSIDYVKYFGEMDLSEEEKERRIKLAEQFEILFLFYFISFLEDESKDYKSMIYNKYIKISMDFINQKSVPYYIDNYAKKITDNIIKVTMQNKNDVYFTSKDRAMFIAENEANTIGNYKQQIEAVKNGKKNKTWITKDDLKVRHSHEINHQLKIGIFDLFQVGNSKMMFPKDTSLGADAEEIVNCRCTVKYS